MDLITLAARMGGEDITPPSPSPSSTYAVDSALIPFILRHPTLASSLRGQVGAALLLSR